MAAPRPGSSDAVERLSLGEGCGPAPASGRVCDSSARRSCPRACWSPGRADPVRTDMRGRRRRPRACRSTGQARSTSPRRRHVRTTASTRRWATTRGGPRARISVCCRVTGSMSRRVGRKTTSGSGSGVGRSECRPFTRPPGSAARAQPRFRASADARRTGAERRLVWQALSWAARSPPIRACRVQMAPRHNARREDRPAPALYRSRLRLGPNSSAGLMSCRRGHRSPGIQTGGRA